MAQEDPFKCKFCSLKCMNIESIDVHKKITHGSKCLHCKFRLKTMKTQETYYHESQSHNTCPKKFTRQTVQFPLFPSKSISTISLPVGLHWSRLSVQEAVGTHSRSSFMRNTSSSCRHVNWPP